MAGLSINGRPGKSNVVSLARHPWCPSDSPKHHRFYLPFTGKPPKNRTTAQWANVFRHCCKVIDLNSLPLGKATGSFGKTILAWDRSHCWCFSCRCLSIFRKALIVEKKRRKNGKRCFCDSALYREVWAQVQVFQWKRHGVVQSFPRPAPNSSQLAMRYAIFIEPRTIGCTESASTEVQELEGSDETWMKWANKKSRFPRSCLAKLGKTLTCMPSCSSFLKASLCLKIAIQIKFHRNLTWSFVLYMRYS